MTKILRDPVHEYIEISPEIYSVLHPTPEDSEYAHFFQRLRYIRQTGPSYLVFPSLQTTRFEHSLGAAWLATRMFDSVFDSKKYTGSTLRKIKRNIRQDFAKWGIRCAKNELLGFSKKIVVLSALLHDIGHLPFSHTLEPAFDVFLEAAYGSLGLKFHEIVTVECLRQSNFWPSSGWLKQGVILTLLSDTDLGDRIGLSASCFRLFKLFVSSELDVDRCDYILRDGYSVGSTFGNYDLERLLPGLSLGLSAEGEWELRVGIRSLSSLESALIERYKLYKYVNWHHKAIFFSEILCRLTAELVVKRRQFRDDFFRRCPRKVRTYFRRIRGNRTFDKDRYEDDLRISLKRKLYNVPFLVFDGRVLNLRDGPYEVEAKSLLGNRTEGYGKFLDDSWLLEEIRRQRGASDKVALMQKCFLLREPLALSLWKDRSELTEISRSLALAVSRSRILIRSLEGRRIDEVHAQSILLHLRDENYSRLQRLVLRPFYKILEEFIEHKFNSRGIYCIIARTPRFLFGDMSKVSVVGRRGEYDQLTEVSPALSQLSALPYELPMFVYYVAEVHVINRLRQQLNGSTRGRAIDRIFCTPFVRTLEALATYPFEERLRKARQELLVKLLTRRT